MKFCNQLLIFSKYFVFRELKAKMEETEKLKEQLRLSKETERALSLRATNLESQLSDREAALRRVESAYNSQM